MGQLFDLFMALALLDQAYLQRIAIWLVDGEEAVTQTRSSLFKKGMNSNELCDNVDSTGYRNS